ATGRAGRRERNRSTVTPNVTRTVIATASAPAVERTRAAVPRTTAPSPAAADPHPAREALARASGRTPVSGGGIPPAPPGRSCPPAAIRRAPGSTASPLR